MTYVAFVCCRFFQPTRCMTTVLAICFLLILSTFPALKFCKVMRSAPKRLCSPFRSGRLSIEDVGKNAKQRVADDSVGFSAIKDGHSPAGDWRMASAERHRGAPRVAGSQISISVDGSNEASQESLESHRIFKKNSPVIAF